MSKVSSTIKKNILMLLRNKISSAAILLGPVIIMVLIGFAFTSPSSYDLALGVTIPDQTPLTMNFVDSLRTQGFVVEEYLSNDECISLIQQGVLQACILFPEDFRIADDKENEIVFFVDETRTNFVYEIIGSVSTSIGVQSSQISANLTDDILLLLWRTEERIDDSLAKVIVGNAQSQSAISKVDESKDELNAMPLSYEEFDIGDVEDTYRDTTRLIDQLRTQSNQVVNSTNALISALELEGYAGTADVDGLKSRMSTFSTFLGTNRENYITAEEDFDELLEDLTAHLEDVKSQLASVVSARSQTEELLGEVTSTIGSVRSTFQELKGVLELAKEDINSLRVTSSETISNPVVTRVEAVASEGNRLMYLFSYLIMLVVLLTGLLLPATLVVMEKRSKSSFRTFTTPTHDRVFMTAHFLTAFIILFLQMAILLGISYYFLGSWLLVNASVSVSILILSLVLFILLGMLIGYSFSTQEAVTMVSISVGSLFLFLSNLVLPLETLSEALKEHILLNPYVLTSEMLRRALLFNTNFYGLRVEFVMLLAYSTLVLAAIVVIKNIMKSRYYLHLAFGHRMKNPKDSYLHLGESTVKSLDDLLDWLKNVDNKQFKEEFVWKDIRKWLAHEKRLRVAIAGKSRTKIISILEKKIGKKE